MAGNARLKHNRRQIQCVTSNPEKKNICMVFSEQMRNDRKKDFKDIFHERIGNQKVRSNAVMALEIIPTFSPGAIKEEDLKN